MSDAPSYVEDINEFLGTYRAPEAEVPICMRMDLQARFEDLDRQLAAVKRRPSSDSLAGSGGEARKLAEQIEAIREEMQKHVRVFLLRALPRRQWSDLLKEHPARPEDAPADFHRDTFPVAALAACSAKPKMSEEQAGKVVDLLTQGQWVTMWNTILELNAGNSDVPFSVAASVILNATRTS